MRVFWARWTLLEALAFFAMGESHAELKPLRDKPLKDKFIELCRTKASLPQKVAISELKRMTAMEDCGKLFDRISSQKEINDGACLQSNCIEDLSILEFFPKLTDLRLPCHKIQDLAPLKFCTKLKTLVLNQNQISKIEVLSSLDQLSFVNLEKNPVKDFGPLKKLRNLDQLFVDGDLLQACDLEGEAQNLACRREIQAEHFFKMANHFEVLGVSSGSLALQEFYELGDGEERVGVDCGYADLKTLAAKLKAPYGGEAFHLVRARLGQQSFTLATAQDVRTFVVHHAAFHAKRCSSAKDSLDEKERYFREAGASGLNAKPEDFRQTLLAEGNPIRETDCFSKSKSPQCLMKFSVEHWRASLEMTTLSPRIVHKNDYEMGTPFSVQLRLSEFSNNAKEPSKTVLIEGPSVSDHRGLRLKSVELLQQGFTKLLVIRFEALSIGLDEEMPYFVWL